MSNPDVPHLTKMMSSHDLFCSSAVSAQNTGISAQSAGSNNPFLSPFEHGQQTLGRSQSVNNLDATPEIPEHGPTGPRPRDNGTPDSDSDDEDAHPYPTPAFDVGSPIQPRSPSGLPPLPAHTITAGSPSASSPPNTNPPPLPARRESTAQQASYAPPPGPPPTRATYACPPGPPPGHRATATQASRQDSLGLPPGSPQLNPQPEIVLPPEIQNVPRAGRCPTSLLVYRKHARVKKRLILVRDGHSSAHLHSLFHQLCPLRSPLPRSIRSLLGMSHLGRIMWRVVQSHLPLRLSVAHGRAGNLHSTHRRLHVRGVPPQARRHPHERI